MTTVLEVAEKRYTVQEWLALEKVSDIRHEYVHGKLIPMAGEAKHANKIAKNILKKMDDRLIEKGFEMYSHDVKAEVVPNGIYRYPDLVVAPVVDDEDDYIIKHPVLMAEVASDDSNKRDRVQKRKEYQNIASMWYYLVVDQDEMLIELHTRSDDGRWEVEYFTEPDDELTFEKFNLTLSVADIYSRVKSEK